MRGSTALSIAAADGTSWPTSWLLDEDEEPMAEGMVHDDVCLLLVLVLQGSLSRRRVSGRAGRNIALRWDASQPGVGVDPDVYLVEPAAPGSPNRKSLKLWEPGHSPPRLAVEVVSESTAEKDYGEGPRKYAASQTRELWVFDPERHGPGRGGKAYVLQVYSRDARGRWRRSYAGDGPAQSKELGAWIVVTDNGTRLRIAEDREGLSLWPTAEESERAQKESERAQKESERAQKESERAQKESERAQKESERAQKESERAQKESERAQKEAALTQREAERAGREAERAGREAERQEKEAERAGRAAERQEKETALAELERLRAELVKLRS